MYIHAYMQISCITSRVGLFTHAYNVITEPNSQLCANVLFISHIMQSWLYMRNSVGKMYFVQTWRCFASCSYWSSLAIPKMSAGLVSDAHCALALTRPIGLSMSFQSSLEVISPSKLKSLPDVINIYISYSLPKSRSESWNSKTKFITDDL